MMPVRYCREMSTFNWKSKFKTEISNIHLICIVIAGIYVACMHCDLTVDIVHISNL